MYIAHGNLQMSILSKRMEFDKPLSRIIFRFLWFAIWYYLLKRWKLIFWKFTGYEFVQYVLHSWEDEKLRSVGKNEWFSIRFENLRMSIRILSCPLFKRPLKFTVRRMEKVFFVLLFRQKWDKKKKKKKSKTVPSLRKIITQCGMYVTINVLRCYSHDYLSRARRKSSAEWNRQTTIEYFMIIYEHTTS